MEDVREPIKVGDFINLAQRRSVGAAVWREVLAVREGRSSFSDSSIAHVAYADATRVQVALYTNVDSQEVEPHDKGEHLKEGMSVGVASVPVSKFGTPYEMAEQVLSRACGTTQNQAESIYEFVATNRHLFGDANQVGHMNHVDFVLEMFEPAKAANGAISLNMTAKDVKRGRRTTMKAGRAFKHMFSNANEKQIAALTEEWIEVNSPRELTLHVGDKPADFRKAYNGDRASYRNPQTTSARKSIATSCMHNVYVYSDDISPAEVYASGDFKVAWLETVGGLIAGRVVFSARVDTKQTHAPIYGACEQSLDMLADYLALNNIMFSPRLKEWDGLHLRKIETDGRYVGPYLDGDLTGEDMGAYILLQDCGRGGIRFENTDGYTSEGFTCEDCGGPVHEDEACMTDNGCLCEYCFDETFVYTEGGDLIYQDEAATVNTRGWKSTFEITVHTEDAVYCEPTGDYWYIDDVTIADCGTAVPSHLVKDYPELFNDDEEEEKEEAA